jgi:predicted MFS family arabinose efflux permease
MRRGSTADPYLRTLISASMLAKVADWQLGIVIPLAILRETNSIALVLFAFALRGLPYAASPLLGSLIDRLDKRVAFIAAQLQQAAVLLLIVVVLVHPVAVGTLLLLGGFGGVVATITGQFVLIPSLFQESERENAVAKLASAIEFSKVLGLVLGGVVFSTLGPRAACLFIAALYLLAGLVAIGLPPIPSQGGRISLLNDLAIGFRWLRRREIFWLVVTMSLSNLAVGEMETVLVTLFGAAGVRAFLVSALLAVGLFAGAIGSRLGPRLLPSLNTDRRIVAFQAMSFGALLVVAAPGLTAKTIGFTLMSFALGASNVASITYRQNTIPVELAGRVNSVIRMFITGAIPLSGFIYAAASKLGSTLFWVPGLTCAALSLAVWSFYTMAVIPERRTRSAHISS